MLFFWSFPVGAESKSLIVGCRVMSVFLKILPFTRRLSDLIKSYKVLIQFLAPVWRGLLLITFWQEHGTKWKWLVHACPSPALVLLQTSFEPHAKLPLFRGTFSRWNLAVSSVLALRSLTPLMGRTELPLSSLTGEQGNRKVENWRSVHERQTSPPARRPPPCFMLSSWKTFWLFGLDT